MIKLNQWPRNLPQDFERSHPQQAVSKMTGDYRADHGGSAKPEAPETVRLDGGIKHSTETGQLQSVASNLSLSSADKGVASG